VDILACQHDAALAQGAHHHVLVVACSQATRMTIVATVLQAEKESAGVTLEGKEVALLTVCKSALGTQVVKLHADLYCCPL
jgi:hypothetical protein